MNTEIEFLTTLETDLDEAARRTKARETGRSRSVPRPRRKLGSNWVSAAALIVAFLVIAGGIGFLAQGGLGGSKDATSAAGPARPQSIAGARAGGDDGPDFLSSDGPRPKAHLPVGWDRGR